MRRSRRHVWLGIATLVGGVSLVWFVASREHAPQSNAGGDLRRKTAEYGGLTISYPLDETLFPPDIVAPTFRWKDSRDRSDRWQVTIDFPDGRSQLDCRVETTQWTPSDAQWEQIKRHSRQQRATVTVLGFNHADRKEILSGAGISISTSTDEVGAPLFYREVILPFIAAVKDPSRIRWRFGKISSKQQPPIVLDKLPVCGNCHSFSADGGTMGMDVDYANRKGSYIILPVAEEMDLHTSRIITWDDYQKEENELSFGLLSQVSPDGRYAISTVKDRSVFVPKPNLAFSQLFFPIKGILVYYCRKTQTFHALPGADDKRFVHSNPAWSPDGKHIVFARSKAYQLKGLRDETAVLLGRDDCREFLEGRQTFQFDLYRIPFNQGNGGKAEPLEGASHNGMSNYFPKYSPDGKWIVFCKAKSFMLLQPDSELYIVPAAGGKARRLRCNTSRMNSWHSWSPNGRWLVFSSKANSPYTQLFLTHVDEHGRSTPPVLLSRFTSSGRAANIPEFVNTKSTGIKKIRDQFVDDYSYCRTGHQLLKEGDYDLALRAYHKALQLNPQNADAHSVLGAMLGGLGMHDQARIHLRKAIGLNPNDSRANRNLGLELVRLDKFEEALTHYREAVRIDPKFAKAHYNLGKLRLDLGQLDGAEHHLSEAVRLDPDDFLARQSLGVTMRRLGKIPEAITQFQAALERDPDYVSAHFELGQILLNHDQFQPAATHLTAALNSAPELFSPLNDLAWRYATSPDPRVQNSGRAVVLAECTSEFSQGKIPAQLDTLAAAYAAAGRFDQAEKTARKAATLAEQAGDTALAGRIRSRLALYRSGKPFRQPSS